MKSRSQRLFTFTTRKAVTILYLLIGIGIFGVIWLCFDGEPFFSLTRRLSANVLIVEGWIGSEGIRAAAEEFSRGAYKYLLITGGMTSDGTGSNSSNRAETAKRQLIELEVPESRIIVSSAIETEREHTFTLAVKARRSFQDAGVRPTSINVFTLGPHARRSQLVYEKVFASEVPVGVIAFVPSSYHTEPWWLSKKRTGCLLKEFVGYPFELLLNSGRSSNYPAQATIPMTGHAISESHEVSSPRE
jgi:hypothetical protein